jgi:DNA primase catalytic core
MARIPEEEIERLKRTIDLAGLVRKRGVKLEKHGKDLIGLCPMHADRSPSLVITPEKNLWNCLGACQAGGSVIDWVMKSEGVSFRHAVELLREGAPLSSAGAVKTSTVRRLPSPVDPDADDATMLGQVARFYHETLLASPDALCYLGKRGIRDEEAITRFQLGLADRSLGLRIPAKNRVEGEKVRSRLQGLGILRESGHEHMSGCLTIPVLDREGQVVAMYGRKISEPGHLRKGTPLHMYLPGPHRGIWNLEAFAESKACPERSRRELILCEALIDALTFWCAGHRNVTSAYGVNGFTDEIFEAFEAYGIERVLIAYDRDDAGDKAATALAERLGAAGIGAFRVNFPRGMDANEYALKVTPAEKSLGLLVRSAQWMAGPTRAGSRSSELGAREKPEEPSSLAAEPPPSDPKPPNDQLATSPHAPSSELLDPLDFTFGDRKYRVRGLEKNLSYEQLKVTLRVASGELFFLDTVDLVSARHRAAFVKQAAAELGVKDETMKHDLAKVHFQLEALQEQLIKKTLEPKKKGVVIPPDEERDAVKLLKDSKLVDRILADFLRCGVVGEETNKLMGYLAAVSRKLDEPLAIIVQSSSAAGKSALMEAVLAFMPEEERVQYSAMTGQSLFYMGETDLKHKVLAIAEEEGAERASYALKLLQSEGELTIASTGKDPHTGKLVTHEYRVEGPVMIFLTTTAIEIDEELLNRCIVLTVDENREQTRAIHDVQRRAQTIEGLAARDDRTSLLRLHRNAQRLLKPVLVANPFAPRLTFLDARTRTRRDHMKYLTLIRAIALLHQYQRETKTHVTRSGKTLEYIEVEPSDIELANRLAHEVLGRSLDELAPQTRRLLDLIDAYVKRECQARMIDRYEMRFSRKTVREFTGWSEIQVRTHIERLVSLEYLLVHRGGRGQTFVYELVYDSKGKDGKPFLPGLIDVGRLHDYVGNFEGLPEHFEEQNENFEGSSSPQRGAFEGTSSTNEAEPNINTDGPFCFPKPGKAPKTHKGLTRKAPLTRRRSGNGRAEA